MAAERGNRKLKLLDRWIGIPMIWFFGGLACAINKYVHHSNPCPRLPPNPPKRIGILMTAAIGDTILVSAVIEDIKSQWPNCEIVLFLGTSNRSMRDLLSDVTLIDIAATHPFRAARLIRAAGYFDVFMDMGQWARLNALLALTAQSGVRVGFKTAGQFRHFGFDLVVIHRADIHELENFRNLARAVGVTINMTTPHLPDFSAKISTIPRSSVKPFAVFHLFAGGLNPYQKEWPRESWIALSNRLPQDWDLLLTGGIENMSESKTFLEFIGAQSPRRNVKSVVGTQSLPETAALLSQAELVVSVNTGILHLAASTGVPTVALNGPTNAVRWGPVGTMTYNVSSPRKCAPCLNLGFDYGCPLDACMREISVDAAWTVVKKAIEGKVHKKPLADL